MIYSSLMYDIAKLAADASTGSPGMNWLQFIPAIAVLITANILLWNIRSEISSVKSDVKSEMTKGFANLEVSIANFRTEMVRETTQNRADISVIQGRIQNT